MDIVAILLPAFVVSLLLLALHTYLGLHVLARGIIFVDLALAQIAALGASVAFWLGYDAHGLKAQLFAVGATLVAALVFTQLRKIKDKTAREVSIGCSYVVATALSVLVLSGSSQGMEELKSLFNGNILWTDWTTVGWVAFIYGVVSLVYFVFRKQLHEVSFSPQKSRFIWEFVFFGSFAIVITIAVNVAGILLVFAYLIIPAFSASLISASLGGRLLWAWLGGTVCTVAGLVLAYLGDLPVGATQVAVLGLMPFGFLVIKQLKSITS